MYLIILFFHFPLCLTKVKRGKLAEHENGALREHMLQILDKNSRLEEQVSHI